MRIAWLFQTFPVVAILGLAKRQVRSPKVYADDSGLLHALLGIRHRDALLGHPKVGASWEGFLIGEILERLGARPEQSFHWATQAGAELDLLVVHDGRRLGFEIKRTSSPRITRSMRVALKDLKLDRLDLVHAGTGSYPLADNVRAVAATRLLKDLAPLER